jgi:hypothetical protein
MMWDNARVASEPFQDFEMFVRGVVVDDDVNDLFCTLAGDDVQEPNELWMPLALHTLTDDRAFETSRAANKTVVP